MPKPTDPKQHKYLFSDDMKFLQKAVVYHPEKPDHMLLLKRSESMFSRPGDWDFPGGNVLYGENHMESILKEIDEETSLKVSEPLPMQVVSRFEKSDLTNNQRMYFLLISYYCTAQSTDVVLSHEHTDFKWVTLAEFNTLKVIDFLYETADIAEKLRKK